MIKLLHLYLRVAIIIIIIYYGSYLPVYFCHRRQESRERYVLHVYPEEKKYNIISTFWKIVCSKHDIIVFWSRK